MDGRKEDILSFLRGGKYNYERSRLDNMGSYGYYWESKTDSDARKMGSYVLSLSSTNLNPQGINGNIDGAYRGNGLSIRCVVKP